MLTFGPRDKIFDFRYFAPLVKMAESEGASISGLLTGSHIPEIAIKDGDYKACANQLERLILNIIDQCRPGIIMDYGSDLNLSAFGIVGYAALSAPTVREALRIANQYIPIVLPGLDIQFQEKDGQTAIRLEWTYPVVEKVQIALIEAALASLYTMARFVLLDRMPAVTLEMKHSLASYHQEFISGKDIEFKGGCRFNQVIVTSDVLNIPLPLANHGTFSMSVKQCDEMLEQLPMSDRTLSAGIQRRLLHYRGERPLTQEDIASELYMSVRSLHRFLQKENTSFREISNEIMTVRAKHLLSERHLSVSQIAQELGYTDAANFTRAFRLQTGLTPSEFRKAE